MQAKLRILVWMVSLGGSLAMTPAVGRTTFPWTNQNPDGLTSGDIAASTNWALNGVPSLTNPMH
jgi:hypothetical protein